MDHQACSFVPPRATGPGRRPRLGVVGVILAVVAAAIGILTPAAAAAAGLDSIGSWAPSGVTLVPGGSVGAGPLLSLPAAPGAEVSLSDGTVLLTVACPDGGTDALVVTLPDEVEHLEHLDPAPTPSTTDPAAVTGWQLVPDLCDGAGGSVTDAELRGVVGSPSGERPVSVAVALATGPAPCTGSAPLGESCSPATWSPTFTVTGVALPDPAPLVVTADAVVDADGDGLFADGEVGSLAAGAAFRVTITNDSVEPVVLDTVTAEQLEDPCADLLGETITPGGHLTCEFAVAADGPGSGGERQDEVVVSVVDEVDGSRRAVGRDATAVGGPESASDGPQVTVDLTVDADGDGTYADAETTPEAGASIGGRVAIDNTGDADVSIDAIQVVAEGGEAVDACPALVGTVLAAGTTAICDVPIPDAGPEPGADRSVTVTVDATAVDDPEATVQADDTATLTTADAEPAVASIAVTHDVDADGDGVFADDEVASQPGSDAVFRVTVGNTGDDPLVVQAAEQVVDGGEPALVCEDLVGTVLDPGDDLTCTFTASGLSPPFDGARISVVTVEASPVDGGDVAEVSDAAVVRTGPEPVLSGGVVIVNDGDGDGVYSGTETGRTAGADVPMRASVTNASPGPAVITDVATSVDGGDAAPICPSLVGTVLQPGTTAVCALLDEGGVPASGARRTGIGVVLEVPGAPEVSIVLLAETTVLAPAPAPAATAVNRTAPVDPDLSGFSSYTIVVTNAGGRSTSEPVVVDEAAPPGWDLHGATGEGWSCTPSERVTCTWSAGSLDPGQSTSPITVRVKRKEPTTTIAPAVPSAGTGGGSALPAATDTMTPIITGFRPQATLPTSLPRTGSNPVRLAQAGLFLVLTGAAMTRRRVPERRFEIPS